MTTADIRKLLGTDTLIIGTQETMKLLRKGNLKKIYLAKNTDSETKEDLQWILDKINEAMKKKQDKS